MQLSSVPRPRFRTDLVAECIEAEGQRFIDVIDPDTGDAFRFYEVEYSLACAMDGERDVQGLAAWARPGALPARARAYPPSDAYPSNSSPGLMFGYSATVFM